VLEQLARLPLEQSVNSLRFHRHVEELPGVRHAMSFEDTAEVAPRIVDWLTRTEEP
jgi:hypothetical protein